MSAKFTDLLHQAAGSQTSAPKRMSARTKHTAQAKKGKAPGIFARLADLYARMETAYNACAAEAGLTCAGCQDNCCVSYFRHHTHVEWAYLWRGLSELPKARQQELVQRAEHYIADARQSLAQGCTPTAMCPLNEDGLCILYSHRLMICRMHGTRNRFTLPDGSVRFFPGCIRFTSLPCAQEAPSLDSDGNPTPDTCPTLDRTPLYGELAELETAFRQRAGKALPRVDLTLAEMIVLGPPKLR